MADDLNPITRAENIIAGNDLTPITRLERFLAGDDTLTPITRLEHFVKQYAGGGGSGGGSVSVIYDSYTGDPEEPNVPLDEVFPMEHFDEIRQGLMGNNMSGYLTVQMGTGTASLYLYCNGDPTIGAIMCNLDSSLSGCNCADVLFSDQGLAKVIVMMGGEISDYMSFASFIGARLVIYGVSPLSGS